MKRPGLSGPPTINANERAKIDEEYLSLMAELGEGNGGKDGHHHGGGGSRSHLATAPHIFQRSQAPRQIMATSAPPQPSAPAPTQPSNQYGDLIQLTYKR